MSDDQINLAYSNLKYLMVNIVEIVSELVKDGAMLTVLSSLVAALTLPATLLTTFDIIDSKWAIAVDR